MKNNRVCELFGIRYPLIQGAVGARHIDLAAAVSEAGGLGTLHGPKCTLDFERDRELVYTEAKLAYLDDRSSAAPETRRERVRRSLREAKRLTDKPFSLNISVRNIFSPILEDLVVVAIEEGVKAVTTAAGSPGKLTRRLKDAGIKVLHVVATTEHAVKAMDAGVDAVIASGFEAGGWQSFEEVTTFALVPQVVDALQGKIPVIAAGGIGDARGVVAAFSLGAEGVQMGTRFLASSEAGLDENRKKAFLAANDTSTAIFGRGSRPRREFTTEFLEKVWPGFDRPELGHSPTGGQVVGLVKDVVSVQEIYDRVIGAIEEAQSRLDEGLTPFLPQAHVTRAKSL